MKKILGIDAGTNSLGWAVVEYDENQTTNKYTLVDKGVNIFSEGVKIEKGIESSKAAERTSHRRLRIGYWRRKVRKINLLRILREAGMCPNVSDEQLKQWRKYKVYPNMDRFMAWQRTDEKDGVNPYYYRHLCLTEKLDLSKEKDRFIIGRALYHINQRRGFLSNRKEETKQSDGAVIQGISSLDQDMAALGYEYLGDYFYDLYQRGEKIRSHYTARLNHYEKELLAICEKQGLSADLTNKIRKAIITQRPLKSQKQSVGHCVFEKKKSRCPASHPLFEQFRMYSFINNIKIKTPSDSNLRPLSQEERESIVPLFLRKSKKEFDFIEIARSLSGTKDNFCYYKDRSEKAYRFNYIMDTSVTGCVVIASLNDAFGVKGNNADAWIDAACEVYTQSEGKSRYEIMNDVWHALFFFDDNDHLREFAKTKLQMDEASAEKFVKIRMPQDYASLSLCAIRKILPYLKKYGLIYSHATFLANLTKVVPAIFDPDELCPMLPEEDVVEIVQQFEKYETEYRPLHKEWQECISLDEYVKTFILRKYNMSDDLTQLDCLYHPSMIEKFPNVEKTEKGGYKQLGSPRTNSLRNPMAMRSLFRIRHVINTLLEKGIIDEHTVVNIEFARELNDSNKRAAIRDWQRNNEKLNQECAAKIREAKEDSEYMPSKEEILKYKLWEEQNHLCLYTGKTIGLKELLSPNLFDIEHTIPRSVGGDTTAENLTVCDCQFNRAVKRNKIPSELSDHAQILERIEHWKEKANELSKQYEKINTRGVSDKDTKDRLIRKKHRIKLERDYWQGKYERFIMTEVPEGFSRRQGIDISVISRYGREYLKSLFNDVYIVKGVTTAEFRRIWGLQDEYAKKERVNHCHHVIDAITIACIGKAEYNRMAEYYHDEERHKWALDSKKAVFPKPWETFTEDVKGIENELLVSHYSRDNMPKHTRKRIRGTRDQYMQGDTARGQLHLETYYGAIQKEGEICYVVRRSLDTLPEKEVETVVDEVVRKHILHAIRIHGSLKKAVENGIYMNEENGVQIKRVRCYAKTVKRPLHIGEHRDVSDKEYKRTFHVQNDSNYIMGIYVGQDAKGKEKREFALVNFIDSARFYKRSSVNGDKTLLPEVSPKGFTLKWSIRPGMLVLLYEKSPQEIYECSAYELSRRLYKVTGLSSKVVNGCNYGTLSLVHHQEARTSTEVQKKSGAYEARKEFRSGIQMYHTQFKALVQDADFSIDDTGKISFMK